jgi:acyl-coenzyme A thioesterase PaaI-like protein
MTASTATLLEDALRRIAGPDALPTSMTIDYGAPAPEAALAPSDARAWVERATRRRVFAQAEVRAGGGELVAAASAVFRRVTPV